MIGSALILDAVILGLALCTPWSLAFDHAGLRHATRNRGRKRALFLAFATAFSVAFSIGFVALGALGAGAFLALDGLAAMEALLPLWLPLLVASAVVATRRNTPVAA